MRKLLLTILIFFLLIGTIGISGQTTEIDIKKSLLNANSWVRLLSYEKGSCCDEIDDSLTYKYTNFNSDEWQTGNYAFAKPKANILEVEVVAKNWINFVVDQYDSWGGTDSPVLGEYTEFKRGDLLLGYYFPVEPVGYIIVSSLKDFIPIKAYSTTSNLDPDDEVGMCDLLKDELERRALHLIDRFGGLDDVSLQELNKFTSDSNRLAWSSLLKSSAEYKANLRVIYPNYPVDNSNWRIGPLLRTSWHQHAPFNDDCPNMKCGGWYNDNAVVGCVPLAIAMILKFFAWPPGFDYPNMANRYIANSGLNPPFEDENQNPVTQAQIDAVATLCYDAGMSLYDPKPGCGIDYGCSSTGADVCTIICNDARESFQDNYYYSYSDVDMPWCEDYEDSYPLHWESMIREEIENNRPMILSISNGNNFNHAVVIDGYDNIGQIHINYGWDNGHNTWYVFDELDCDKTNGFQGGCILDDMDLIRLIFPRTGYNKVCYDTLGPWGGPGSYHHYIYCNVTKTRSDYDTPYKYMTVLGGAWVQFLPGESITCSHDSVYIYGRSPGETRFFSDGLPTRGLKVCENGVIKLNSNGRISIY